MTLTKQAFRKYLQQYPETVFATDNGRTSPIASFLLAGGADPYVGDRYFVTQGGAAQVADGDLIGAIRFANSSHGNLLPAWAKAFQDAVFAGYGHFIGARDALMELDRAIDRLAAAAAVPA